jgi:hypothetical protein
MWIIHAITGSGITVGERVKIPDALIPADARVEMDAKVAAGYFTDGDFVELDGPLLSRDDVAAGELRFGAADPRRHIAIDARQREVVRDARSGAFAEHSVRPSFCARAWRAGAGRQPEADGRFGCVA